MKRKDTCLTNRLTTQVVSKGGIMSAKDTAYRTMMIAWQDLVHACRVTHTFPYIHGEDNAALREVYIAAKRHFDTFYFKV